MLRLPAVAGRFYPSNPEELTALIRECVKPWPDAMPPRVQACLVPHAGYMFSGHVAGAVFSRIALPQRIVILGVRHFPRGESLAMNTSGAWRTPLGDVPIDEALAATLKKECPILSEDRVAHGTEHSLEVQLPCHERFVLVCFLHRIYLMATMIQRRLPVGASRCCEARVSG